jgi:hypothetical protein
MKKALLFSGIFLSVLTAFAQDDTSDETLSQQDTIPVKGTLSGRVLDENGLPMKGVELYVYDGNDIIGSATTDSVGAYLTNRMYIGTYDLVSKYAGYERQKLQGIEVKAWQDTKQDLDLRPIMKKVDSPRVDAVKVMAVPAGRRHWWRRREVSTTVPNP